MKTQLTQKQFIAFVEYVWNMHLPSWREDLWGAIASMESRRTFNEGWGYCESKLEMSTENGLSWRYETTSGTILAVTQSRWVTEEGSLEPQFEVEIPENRAQKGRTHYDYLQAVLAEIPYLSWGEYFYGNDHTALKVHTYWSGGDVQVLEARTSELKRQLGLREKKSSNSEIEHEYDYDEDYEGAEEDYEGAEEE